MITIKEVQRVLMLVGVSQVVRGEELETVRKHFDLDRMFKAVSEPLVDLVTNDTASLSILVAALKDEFPEFVVTPD